MTRTKYYATVFYPGLIFSETATVDLPDNPTRESVLRRIPENACGYQVWERTETVVNGETLKGEPKKHGPHIYFGEKWTVARVKRELPGERILIANMEGNGYAACVRTSAGQFWPLNKGDEVIESREHAHV